MKFNVSVCLLTVILVVSGLLGFVGITIRDVQAATPNLLVGGPVNGYPAYGTWTGHRGNRTNTVGNTVRYTVNITDVTQLWGFDFTLAWGMAVLELKLITLHVNGQPTPTSVWDDGIFVPPLEGGQTTKIAESTLNEGNRTAIYRCAYAQIGDVPTWNWTSGKGCVVYLDYKVLSPGGECDLYFKSASMTFKNGSAITHTKQEGYFYLSGKKRVPTVTGITVSPATKIANKTIVSFDGSGVSDPDGAGIKSYIWNLGQDKPIIPAFESPYADPVTHIYPPNVKVNYTLTRANAIRMRVFFWKIDMKSGDYVRIRDKSNVLIQTLPSTVNPPGGGGMGYWSNWVKGDTININFTSANDLTQGWGFKADHYNCYLNVTTTPLTHTFTILQSDYPTTTYGPYPFTASLSVVDNEGSQSKTVATSFSLVHPRPFPQFTFSPNVTHYYPTVNAAYIIGGKTVNFDASGSYDPDPAGGIAWYYWDFGDGTNLNKTSPTASHKYNRTGGLKQIGLTIKDTSDGLTSFTYYNLYVYNMTEFARAYGGHSVWPNPPSPNWNYFYDISQDNYVNATDLLIMGRSYY